MGKQFKIYLLLLGMSVLLFSGCAGGDSRLDTESSAEQGTASAVEKSSTEEREAEESSAEESSTAGESSAEESSDAGESSAVNTETSGETEPSGVIAFEAQDMEGNLVSADIFSESRLTMVNVWATYCGPCLYEMPELGELAKEYDPAEFQIIGIISDVLEGSGEETMTTAADLIAQTGADYPHLLLNESLYYALLTDVSAVPTTFFINENGEILKTVVGAQKKSAWEDIINELLEEE